MTDDKYVLEFDTECSTAGYCGGTSVFLSYKKLTPGLERRYKSSYTKPLIHGSPEAKRAIDSWVNYAQHKSTIANAAFIQLLKKDIDSFTSKYRVWQIKDDVFLVQPTKGICRDIDLTLDTQSDRPLLVPSAASYAAPDKHNMVHINYFGMNRSTDHPLVRFANRIGSKDSICMNRHNTRSTYKDCLISCVGANLLQIARKEGTRQYGNDWVPGKWTNIHEDSRLWICFPFPVVSNLGYGNPENEIGRRAESLIFLMSVGEDPTKFPQVKEITVD